jgi:hypothetical protein
VNGANGIFKASTTYYETTKISLVVWDKSHAILVTNDKGYWMKKKSTNTSSSFDFSEYVLSHVIKM